MTSISIIPTFQSRRFGLCKWKHMWPQAWTHQLLVFYTKIFNPILCFNCLPPAMGECLFRATMSSLDCVTLYFESISRFLWNAQGKKITQQTLRLGSLEKICTTKGYGEFKKLITSYFRSLSHFLTDPLGVCEKNTWSELQQPKEEEGKWRKPVSWQHPRTTGCKPAVETERK